MITGNLFEESIGGIWKSGREEVRKKRENGWEKKAGKREKVERDKEKNVWREIETTHENR